MAKFMDLVKPSNRLEVGDHPGSTVRELGGQAHDAARLTEYFLDIDGRPSPTDNHPGSPADHYYTEAEMALRSQL